MLKKPLIYNIRYFKNLLFQNFIKLTKRYQLKNDFFYPKRHIIEKK